VKQSYLEDQYSAYTYWDDVEEYEHHDLENVVSLNAIASNNGKSVLVVIAHGIEHPLSGLPEERTFIELTVGQFQQLATTVHGIEQQLYKR
jgi:hypothetical protein